MKYGKSTFIILVAIVALMTLGLFGILHVFGFGKCWGVWRNIGFVLIVTIYWSAPLALAVAWYHKSLKGIFPPAK